MSQKEADQELLSRYSLAVNAFKQFCLDLGGGEDFEEVDFHSLSLGFFIALGVTSNLGDPDVEPDAFALARITRYQLQYWEHEGR